MTANRLGLIVAVLLLAMGCNEGNFNTFDNPPSVEIQEPADGSVIESAATSITFWGTVLDEQDLEEDRRSPGPPPPWRSPSSRGTRTPPATPKWSRTSIQESTPSP